MLLDNKLHISENKCHFNQHPPDIAGKPYSFPHHDSSYIEIWKNWNLDTSSYVDGNSENAIKYYKLQTVR
jgi:hypothetical protein